jgi:hypothetical protein
MTKLVPGELNLFHRGKALTRRIFVTAVTAIRLRVR